MFNAILSILFGIVISCSSLVSISRSTAQPTNHEFVAVFQNPGDNFDVDWRSINPNYIMIGRHWSTLHQFICQAARRSAGYDTVVIDIDSHGDDDGLYLQYQNSTGRLITEKCSLGYVCNEIDTHFGKRNVVVLIEGCYAGRAYKHTIRGNDSPKGLFGNHQLTNHKGVPSYPIYGIGSLTTNFGNYMYLQYVHPDGRKHFEDLRHYETDELGNKESMFSTFTYSVFADFMSLRTSSGVW